MADMARSDKHVFGSNVRRLREALGLTQADLAEASELDRSYIGGVERGERNPALNAIVRLSSALNVPPRDLFEGVGEDGPRTDDPNAMRAIPSDDGLLIRFKYDQYDAQYPLIGATPSEFSDVLAVLTRGLKSGTSRSDAVARAFLRAVKTWPDANASDLWTFVISRAYSDRSNHPSANARLNLEQSWKRASGWALERILVAHYAPFLLMNGISVKMSSKAEKTTLLGGVDDSRINPDKADILLSYDLEGETRLLGAVHVKASIAERRTDDVPMSRALLETGHLSVFWTMDSKSFPAARPVNSGEFGDLREGRVSEKRRDFEEHGHFSACFSYNRNTMPTEASDAVPRIFVCDFTSPNDPFSQFLVRALHQRLLA